jgi:hypothetical protein
MPETFKSSMRINWLSKPLSVIVKNPIDIGIRLERSKRSDFEAKT